MNAYLLRRKCPLAMGMGFLTSLLLGAFKVQRYLLLVPKHAM